MPKKTSNKATLQETQLQFKQFYQNNLQEIYRYLEPIRKKYLKQFCARIIYSLVINLLLFFALDFFSVSADVASKIFVFDILAVVILLYLPLKNYRTTTKNKVMKKILSFWGNFDYFEEKSIIHPQNIKKSELFRYYNTSDIDDTFEGTYNGTEVIVSEQELHQRGNKFDALIFRGVFILLDFKKKYNRLTVVKSKKNKWIFLRNNPLLFLLIALFLFPLYFMGQAFYHALKSGIDFGTMYLFAHLLKMVFPLIIVAVIYLIYRRYHPKKATKLVTLEDMSFLKKWKVLTNDQIDARYILTPVFMEKIKEINRLFKGNAVDFSFFGGKLLIAIHTNKDLFETTSIFSESTDYRRVEDVVEQIYSIFAMVDLLKQQIK